MLKKTLLGVLAAAVLLGPSLGLVGLAALANPAAESYAAGCIPGTGGRTTGPLADNAPVPKRARAWIRKAAQTCTALPEVWIAAVMYQETNFRPGLFADDVNGGTWGLFQLNRYIWADVYGPWSRDRDSNGTWDIKEPFIHSEYGAKYLCDLLKHVRQTRKRHPDWESTRRLTELEALVVAHNGGPGRLATYPDIAPVTRKYIKDVRRHMKQWADPTGNRSRAAPVTGPSRVVIPLPDKTYRITSRYGPRRNPFGPGQAMHWGLDFAAPQGTSILAVADGSVVRAGMVPGDAGTIDIAHTIYGHRVATRYKHMWSKGIHVKKGDQVRAGQHIGDVGSSGHSTGPHLHRGRSPVDRADDYAIPPAPAAGSPARPPTCSPRPNAPSRARAGPAGTPPATSPNTHAAWPATSSSATGSADSRPEPKSLKDGTLPSGSRSTRALCG